MQLEGKTVLVTGGATRIGRGLCLACAQRGMRVLVHYRRSGAEAEALCHTISELGTVCHALSADLEEAEDCTALLERAARAGSPVDMLVNNAAMFEADSLRAFDPLVAARQWAVNAMAPLHLMRAFAARDPRPGRIVNLLDRRIVGHDTRHVSYLLAKKALMELTALAALEWAPHITVNAVAPGAILPPPGRTGMPAGHTLLKKPCRVEDVASAVLFLAASDVVTGQVIYVDAGQHLLGDAADPA